MPAKNLLPENFLRGRAFAPAALAFLLLWSCSRQTQQATTPIEPHLSYVLSIPSVDTIHVSATVTPDDRRGPVQILFPPFDADNPVITFRGNNIHNLKLTDASIDDSLRMEPWLGDSVQSLLVNSAAASFSIDYDVTFPYDPNGSPTLKTILPGKYGAAEGYFQGNYVFCVPAYGATKALWWRRSIDCRVSLAKPVAGTVHGVPTQPFPCYTIYELFFLQWAISDRVTDCGSFGQGASIVVLSANEPPPDVPSLICEDLTVIDSFCHGVFPQLLAPRTVILQDSGDGMEGTFSFYMINRQGNDYTSYSRPITAHEGLHAWIGIRCGDLDDPWWKEGTASYFGRVLGVNLGFPKDTVRPTIVKDLKGNPMIEQRAMSDPFVRDHLYDKDANVNCAALVYDKGGQTCMILDKIIRGATGNTATLFSKTGELCTRYDHTGFSRGQFKALLEENTGLDLTGFFASYVDGVGVIDTATLASAWRFVDSCGAFNGKP